MTKIAEVNGISIHAPAKGATRISSTVTPVASYFNPRSREGSDGVCRAYAPEEGRFQSTLPRRERPYNRSGQLRDHRYFNPRSREGSDATFPRPRLRRDTRFQSTLPRRERPACGALGKLLQAISIHAPAKGATARCDPRPSLWCISIHAPAKGATRIRQSAVRVTAISIHAPAKGATCA